MSNLHQKEIYPDLSEIIVRILVHIIYIDHLACFITVENVRPLLFKSKMEYINVNSNLMNDFFETVDHVKCLIKKLEDF